MNWFHNWFESKYYNILYRNRDFEEAALFINNLLEKINPDTNTFFLDLGCGSGRHSIFLNKKGYKVDGIDLSKKSLVEAKKYENEKLTFYNKDMRDFCFRNKYDVIVNLFTSFGYFEKDNDNKKVFSNISKSLKKNGYLIIDFFNADKIINNLKKYEIKEIEDVKFEINRKEDGKFVYKEINIKDRNNNFTFVEKVRLIKRQQFINYAKEFNMHLIDTFGDYYMSKFEKINSDRLIMIFQK